MNFAIPFVRNFKYFNQNIQLNINYKPKIKELDSFIASYGTYRINFIISDFKQDRDYEIINVLREKYPETNIVLCFPKYNKNLEQQLIEQKIPHYYNELVTDWDKFNGFLSLSVTDIFIAENLAFDLENLSLNAKKYNKSLRSFCNVCESSWDETPSIKTFFIRPEDIDLYAKYIDTFEFYTDTRSAVRINTLYEIYTKDKRWFGKLNEIIVGYEGDEDSRFIIPIFGEKRLNCDKRCMKGISPTCKICDRIVELSKSLEDKEIMVSIKKTEKEHTEVNDGSERN